MTYLAKVILAEIIILAEMLGSDYMLVVISMPLPQTIRVVQMEYGPIPNYYKNVRILLSCYVGIESLMKLSLLLTCLVSVNAIGFRHVFLFFSGNTLHCISPVSDDDPGYLE